MEEDALLKFHEKLKDFLQRHLNLFINIVLIFVIIIILGGAWVYYQKYSERKAFQELVQILHKNDLTALENFTKKHAGDPAGLNAALIIWEVLSQGEDIKGKKEYLEVLKKGYPKKLSSFLRYAEAKLLEDLGKRDETFKIYEELLKKEPFLEKVLYLDLGRLAEAKNPALAKNFYEKLINKDKEAFGVPLANYKIYRLQ
ncbi:MAG: hypothetical protein ACK4FM_03655 [Caldimicrobium sp.]